ncbi:MULTISPECIES: MBL fold metallo-hydrolase [unclassified Acidovorax]|uniref:MBL fold metallo-hydrolase n=1 Tax=unclassified Acidovorax TaxID=2684926 RepID=UPI000BC70DA4|nr:MULTISPECIES: MBL fold metallo-hydrolase [unclassified Acidovorax]MCL5739604.1 MBL fold metallo-hydrolase [Betaproteobacteria bacterium]OZA57128.1 MAG: MBL fold metallo-hydrolase [Acidovorax sp. 17-64-282]HQS20809.1 MBL fold metallo-hydrolase [Acidovorax defluvii]OYY83395.1 MAG: MBL fold metallo-hydrolase [Acidovorax sp. 28-64-14]OYZ67436.1 MAG: MBL fold metallo-hydrolase [Acidovorax sp. 24-64-9]
MTRPSQLLHPHREPVATRPAATVLLLRDTPDNGGLEVLMTRRSGTASFAPGAYVFPGGGIDALDASPESHAAADRRPAQGDLHLTQAIAAIRESFEELGVLLARHTGGPRKGLMADAHDIAAINRHQPFAAQCTARGLRLAADSVYLLAHWTGDRDLPRRFEVPFLVARMPEGQEPVADETEQFEPVWVRPADALARHEAGQFFMIYPTIRTLQRLAKFDATQAVLDAVAHEQPLWVSCPRAGLLGGTEARYMEDEMPFGELALVCPDGQIVHPLDWQTERAVPLLRNVQRLTAPNPGVMTGPGTNSYLVGDPATGFIAIDPGPADAEHLDKLWRAAGGDIRMIVCTHSHPDHSPGAAPLQALCVQAGRAAPPILGLPSAPTARAASAFTPDRALQNNELLALMGKAPEGEITHTLQVIHTPGHAANHLCLLLQEDGLLFSGDHILNGSTTVIDPPDGNMADYLDSLDRLDALCAEHSVEFILPAHGHVLGGPINGARSAIAKLKAHRLAREAKVLAAMQALPDGSMEDWVQHAYDDVPPRMWPVAQRSLLAHVERIRSQQPGNN